MIDRIIDFSARNRFIIFIIVAVLCLAGFWSMLRVPVDAVPDLSDTQVIVYSRWDRSPDIVEDQLTYPIVTAMVGAPGVRAVRGFSDFGYSFVYVIFEDGTDVYWARSRTLEYLSSVLAKLPADATTEIGPDASGLGWVYQYALVDTTGHHSLAELRSYHDWYLRYYLKALPGVAEVAAIGGFRQQYQVNVDPNRLRSYGLSIRQVVDAVRGGNIEAGGRLVEFAGTEYMVRGRGYVASATDLENIVLRASESGTPIRIRDVGQVTLGPELRRGVSDLDGTGEAVSGIVIMRQGANALDVIDAVKARLDELTPGLPAGVQVRTVYDRSDLIHRAIGNLRWTLIEVMLTVSVVVLLFLWHVPSALIPILTIPIALLISFLPFRAMGLTANIMSLGGLAIAISALVDASIVVVEQTHKRLEEWKRTGSDAHYREIIVAAVKEVGAPSFFALLVIAVSFLPVLTLEAQEGRMFKPLAYTKTLAIGVAALLAITLDPALRLAFTRLDPFRFRPRWLRGIANRALVGTVHREEDNPVSRGLIRLYNPAARWALRRKGLVIAIACVALLATLPAYLRLGSEFMPPLDEGSLLYMPSTLPGVSIAEAQKLLQMTDRIIMSFPEVAHVFGKAGRAETATDPAPLSMLETVIVLKPPSEWRRVPTWYSSWAPDWMTPLLRRFTPDRLSAEQLVAEMDAALKIPGLSNAWTMPIKGRIDMLTTGIRTPIGIKISGADLSEIERIGTELEALLPRVAGTRNVFSERAGAGYFLDVHWNRDELARYGVSLETAQAAVQNAIGGENVTTAIAGRERYPVNVRYLRDFRDDIGALRRVMVPAGGERQIPVAELASVQTTSGPSMIRNEGGLLTGYVYVDIAGRDPGSYVEEARRLVAASVRLPSGYAVFWSGQYEAMERVRRRLTFILPLTAFIIFLLLYLSTRSVTKTMIVALAVPFSAIGAIWFVYLLGYNMSIAVWVGLIALLGIDAETGVFMLLYLDLAYERAKREGRLGSADELREAVIEGAVKRIRPKFMTVSTDFVGLVPVMLAVGAGSEVMKRMAAPIVGGLITSFALELLLYPVIYELWKWHTEVKPGLTSAERSVPALTGALP